MPRPPTEGDHSIRRVVFSANGPLNVADQAEFLAFYTELWESAPQHCEGPRPDGKTNVLSLACHTLQKKPTSSGNSTSALTLIMPGDPIKSVAPSQLTAVQIGMTAAKSGRGGLDRYFFSLTRALPQHGIGVRGLVVGDPDDIEPEDSIECFAPEQQGLLRRWIGLRGAVSKAIVDSDIVVSHFAPYAFPVLDKLRHRPFVIHFHGPWALEGAAEGARRPVIFAKHLLERIVYSRGVKLIVLSKAFGSILEQQYGVPPDAIRIVPGGVDLDQFQCSLSRNAARQQLGLPLDRPTIVSVRRLVRAKGIENLIDATAILRKRIPDILVVVAGTGPLANDLALRVQERGLSESLRFAGYVAETDLPTLYRAADLFVVPTIALEGFGLVVVEALACGTPVIVTPVAGLPEVITDLDPSLVLAGSDSETLARGIGDAITGQTPLPNSHACTAYAQRFGWSQIAQRVADIYRDAR